MTTRDANGVDPIWLITQPGTRIRKVGGSYQAEGYLRSVFTTGSGEARIVFEFREPKGLLHIFRPDQIKMGWL